MRFGIFVSYGQASGPLPLIDSQELSRRGSLFFTRPSLMHYKSDSEEYRTSLSEIFELLCARPHPGQCRTELLPLRRWQRPPRAGAGKTTGSTILIVN